MVEPIAESLEQVARAARPRSSSGGLGAYADADASRCGDGRRPPSQLRRETAQLVTALRAPAGPRPLGRDAAARASSSSPAWSSTATSTTQATVGDATTARCGPTWSCAWPAASNVVVDAKVSLVGVPRGAGGHGRGRRAPTGSRRTPGTCATTSTSSAAKAYWEQFDADAGVRRPVRARRGVPRRRARGRTRRCMEHAFERNVVLATPADADRDAAHRRATPGSRRRSPTTPAGLRARPRALRPARARWAATSTSSAARSSGVGEGVQPGGRLAGEPRARHAPAGCTSSRSSTTELEHRRRQVDEPLTPPAVEAAELVDGSRPRDGRLRRARVDRRAHGRASRPDPRDGVDLGLTASPIGDAERRRTASRPTGRTRCRAVHERPPSAVAATVRPARQRCRRRAPAQRCRPR